MNHPIQILRTLSRYLSANGWSRTVPQSTWTVVALRCLVLGLCGIIVQLQAATSPSAPTVGTQFNQIPSRPINQPKTSPQLQLEQDSTAVEETGSPDMTTIPVREIKISDASVFSEKELLKISGYNGPGDMTLKTLRSYAARIADYYHQNGYLLAQVYLPAQDIVKGIVQISVIEGRFGAVTVRNETGYADALLTEVLYGLRSGDPISVSSLESRLLLLSDIPGMNVKSTFVPGRDTGTSDLFITATPGDLINGNIIADNSGNTYSGKNRAIASVNINNPSGYGDVISLRGMSTFNGLNYGRFAYQIQSNRLKLGADFSKMDYNLNDPFAGVNGNGTTTNVFGSYALLRTRKNNLYVQMAYESKVLRDALSDKRVNLITATLSGDRRDAILGKEGTSNFSLALSAGRLNIESGADLASDQASTGAHVNGRFNRVGMSLTRLQTLNEKTNLYVSLSGQGASKNMDVSEKFSLGGANSVRAYPEGEAYGDIGYILTVELRRKLGDVWGLPGEFQATTFLDTGTDLLYKSLDASNSLIVTSTGNRRTLTGIGVGLDWSDGGDTSLRASYAHKLGAAATTSVTNASGGQFWIQGSQNF